MDLRSRMGEELTDEEKEQMRKFREEQMKKRDMEKNSALSSNPHGLQLSRIASWSC